MPYENPRQAVAIFLDIKRRKGDAAAHRWARKHRADFKREAARRARATTK